MNLITPEIEKTIRQNIIQPALQGNYTDSLTWITKIIDLLYKSIPDNKRISYGRVHTIKTLSQYLYNELIKLKLLYKYASFLFKNSTDYKTRGVGLGLLSFYGLEHFNAVLPYFNSAAADTSWDVREFSQMFFRKLIKQYPQESHEFLLKSVCSPDPNIRRFVSETLRPVQENKWFYKQPEYSLSVLEHLFREPKPYPRTSVGNNLSDLARRLPDLVYELVKELAASKNRNSYWIAYRACRNLVKKEPLKVMDLLQIHEYKYKNRIHRRNEY